MSEVKVHRGIAALQEQLGVERAGPFIAYMDKTLGRDKWEDFEIKKGDIVRFIAGGLNTCKWICSDEKCREAHKDKRGKPWCIFTGWQRTCDVCEKPLKPENRKKFYNPETLHYSVTDYSKLRRDQLEA